LLPDPETPGGLLVRFVFDANLPCYLSAFLVATDAPREGSRLALTDGRQVQTRRVKKLAGLGQTGEVSVSKLDADALKKYLAENRTGADSSDDSLTNPTHALIVRLECVVPASTAVDGTADTDPVSVLEPAAPTGSALTATSQAQTTFSKVAFADPGTDKAFVTSVTKQKIWVDSVSYELQEIFGIEHCTAGTPLGENGIGDGDGDDAGKECVVCMSEPRDTTVRVGPFPNPDTVYCPYLTVYCPRSSALRVALTGVLAALTNTSQTHCLPVQYTRTSPNTGLTLFVHNRRNAVSRLLAHCDRVPRVLQRVRFD
jgi:hypothetical protein